MNDADNFLMKALKWFEPEIKEMFPEPGSFSGLMLLWPGLWFSLIKLKIKNGSKAKDKK